MSSVCVLLFTSSGLPTCGNLTAELEVLGSSNKEDTFEDEVKSVLFFDSSYTLSAMVLSGKVSMASEINEALFRLEKTSKHTIKLFSQRM